MEEDIQKLIENLNKKLIEYKKRFEKVQEEVKVLKNNTSTNQGSFWDKEKELGDLKVNLQSLQVEKDNCSLKLNGKIEELKNSNLSNDDKVQKIIDLFSGRKKELDEACHSLTNHWVGYGKLQERMNGLLEQRLKEQQWMLEKQEDSKKRMMFTVYVLLGVIIILSLSLSLCYATRGKKKEPKIPRDKNVK